MAIVIALVVAVLSGCAGETPDARPSPVREWRTEVVATYPHDGKAFTQGLELRDGMLYEGTGRYGSSWITVSDFPSGTVRERVDLEPELFGEGITLVGDTIWQLTWRNGVALLRDRASLSEIRRVRYQGEGWGICYQSGENRLVMSDGTNRLSFRDPESFRAVGSVAVTLRGRPLSRLNELECVGDSVWANVYGRNELVRIDPDSGEVTDVVRVPMVHREGVLNGIAAIPGTDELLITGKNWPTMYRVRLARGFTT